MKIPTYTAAIAGIELAFVLDFTNPRLLDLVEKLSENLQDNKHSYAYKNLWLALSAGVEKHNIGIAKNKVIQAEISRLLYHSDPMEFVLNPKYPRRYSFGEFTAQLLIDALNEKLPQNRYELEDAIPDRGVFHLLGNPKSLGITLLKEVTIHTGGSCISA